MSSEIVIPFSLTPSGSVNITTDPAVQTEQHIKCLCATEPSERVMMPTYGVPLRNAVFAPDDSAIITSMQSFVDTAIRTFEPSVVLQSVTAIPIAGDPDGSMQVEVNWVSAVPTNPSAAAVTTAVILVGGTVVESGTAA